jgi:signal transduction histidine kinase
MFKRTRVRIIGAIMAALLMFLLIAIGVIYASSYHEIQTRNNELLEQFDERFELMEATTPPEGEMQQSGPPGRNGYFIFGDDGDDYIDADEYDEDEYSQDGDIAPGTRPGEFDRRDKHAFELSTFYFVALSDSGEVLAIDSGNGDLFDDEDLTEMALDILEDGSEKGTEDGLIYLVDDKDDYTLVSFMDNSVVRDNMSTLIKNTLISFGISVVVVFLLALLLSKKIIAPLEENDKRQKQFVSDAGHELKTPLAVMSANCELLSKEIGSNQWLENIQYENQRMSTLVKDLLDLSRAENGTLQEETVDLSNLVLGESLPFESIAFEQGLMIGTDVKDGIITKGNPTQLKQLTAILIDNAISHSEGGNEVNLSLTSEGKTAHLRVTNSGKEIPPDKQALIFERFYRVDEARTEDGGNHYGLGLAIAKAITQAHGGKISVECGDGKVTFKADIPIKQ